MCLCTVQKQLYAENSYTLYLYFTIYFTVFAQHLWDLPTLWDVLGFYKFVNSLTKNVNQSSLQQEFHIRVPHIFLTKTVFHLSVVTELFFLQHILFIAKHIWVKVHLWLRLAFDIICRWCEYLKSHFNKTNMPICKFPSALHNPEPDSVGTESGWVQICWASLWGNLC